MQLTQCLSYDTFVTLVNGTGWSICKSIFANAHYALIGRANTNTCRNYAVELPERYSIFLQF